MKGEIFNLLEAFIIKNWGVDTFEHIFEVVHDQLKTKTPFIGPGTYPDSDFMALLNQAVAVLGVTPSVAMFEFGKFSYPYLAAKVPELLVDFKHPKQLLLAVQTLIHVEVRKLYRDAELPTIYYEDPGPRELVMIYVSRRRLYDFFEGLVHGAAESFGTPIVLKREMTTVQGQEAGKFHITFG